MNKIKYLTLLFVAGILIMGTSCTSKNEKNEDTIQSGTTQAVLVKTMVVKQEPITRTIDYTATLVPFEEVHLAPSTPGRIEKIDVEISDNVSKGQVVAVMDRTNLEQARINLMKLETDFNRMDTLKKTESISDQQYDQIKSAYDIAKTSYEFLLENTQLKAPFNGVISGKYFEDGEIYSGAPNALIGKAAIVSIVQINQLKVLLGISASYYPLITKGMQADVNSEIYPDLTFKGEVFRIYPTIDNATKTFTVEVKIQNDNLKLRPGMFSKIKLDLGKGKAIMVPTIALIKQTGTNDMYIFLNKNNIALKQQIKTGRTIDDKTEILEGINEGDEIIVVGQNKLENKMAITIVK
ncbi:MAG: efflux RND transporter periplasmic adaptor subunit [Salinivirgaceae bacterium]|nr:efflux RND transporter periplasmic adaptor subunit [Salinivirgaceae bacterium]